ncbi:hypothetical protein EUTSA_v10022428mg [Eutrema salsugineum]|uniref:F-box domain-containing protein n=1 Tax=Eutrema salsugineum TaxID=72664 RepID=V4LZI9_EUTSA|nr:hypothetical protein EUTSA_v10022428mg [Eutrema salsugineum]
MSSPEREKRKKNSPSPSPTPQSTPIPSLPNDLLLICVARVPRLYYPTLSLVSKSFRSLIATPELYKARSLLGRTESCLYVCTQPCGSQGPTWYTLCRRPLWRVSRLDCRSHTWSEAPSLREDMCLLSAGVIDGKIYVAGRHATGVSESENSFQVFDTESQTWDLPGATERGVYAYTATMDGKFHVVTIRGDIAYDPKEGRWDDDKVARRWMGCWVRRESHCEIDNVLYSVVEGEFVWFDSELDYLNLIAKLADYGGKMALVWQGEKKMIWCAEIVLERRDCREIWGKVEWFDHVLSVCGSCDLVKAIAATV